MALHHRHDDPLSSPTPSLSFSQLGGPFVAVAGLCGGAGTSTLAHLLAAAAAVESSAPILLVETGGPSASLSLLAGAASPHTLVELAREVEAGHAPNESPFAVIDDGLRLIAAAPQFEREIDESTLERVFDDAHAAHGLTVVDCSSLTADADLVALRKATHIVWSAPATDLAAARASAVFEALDLPLMGRELLAVRHAAAGTAVPATRWTAIAHQRDCDIVLVPDVPSINGLPVVDRVDRAGAALDALAGVLR